MNKYPPKQTKWNDISLVSTVLIASFKGKSLDLKKRKDLKKTTNGKGDVKKRKCQKGLNIFLQKVKSGKNTFNYRGKIFFFSSFL